MNIEAEYKISNLGPLEKSLVYLLKSGGDIDVIRVLIESSFIGKKPQGKFCFQNRDDDNKSLLHYVVEYYDLELFDLMVQHLPERAYNLENTNGETALVTALQKKLPIAKVISDKLTSLANSVNGKSYLSYAAEYGREDFLITVLAETSTAELEAFYNSRYFLDHDGNSPIHHAAMTGQCGVIQLLADHHCLTDTINNLGETPLIVASKHNQLASVQRLLQLGSNPNIRDFQGETALHHACRIDNRAMIGLLIANDAYQETCNKKWQKPVALNAISREVLPLFKGLELKLIALGIANDPVRDLVLVIDSKYISKENRLDSHSNLARREIYLHSIDYIQDQIILLKDKLEKYQGRRAAWVIYHTLGTMMTLLFLLIALTAAIMLPISKQVKDLSVYNFIELCILHFYPATSDQNFSKLILYLNIIYNLGYCDYKNVVGGDLSCHIDECPNIVEAAKSFITTLMQYNIGSTFKVVGIIFSILFVTNLVLQLMNKISNIGPYNKIKKFHHNLATTAITVEEQQLISQFKDYISEVIVQIREMDHSMQSPQWQRLLDSLNNAVEVQDLQHSVNDVQAHFQNEIQFVSRHAMEGVVFKHYENPARFFNRRNNVQVAEVVDWADKPIIPRF